MSWESLAGGFIGSLASSIVAYYLFDRWFKQWQSKAEWEKARNVYERQISRVDADNKDLRDRLFQSKAMPPSDVDLTEVYEERKKNEREHKERSGGKHLPPGPLERVVEKWKNKDLKAADQGVDLTKPKHRAN